MPIHEKNSTYCDEMNILFHGQKWFKHIVDEAGRIVLEFDGLPESIDVVGSNERLCYHSDIWREFYFPTITADTPEDAFRKMKAEIQKRVDYAELYIDKHLGENARQHIQVLDTLGEKIQWLLDGICHYEWIFGREELREMDQSAFFEFLYSAAHEADDGFTVYIDDSGQLILRFPDDCQWEKEYFCWAADFNGTYMKVDEPTVMHITGENGEEMLMHLKNVLNQYNADDYIVLYITTDAREIIEAVDQVVEVFNNMLDLLTMSRGWVLSKIE